jgi:hypothetical protein
MEIDGFVNIHAKTLNQRPSDFYLPLICLERHKNPSACSSGN